MKIIETNTLILELNLKEITGLIDDIEKLPGEYVQNNDLVNLYNILRGND